MSNDQSPAPGVKPSRPRRPVFHDGISAQRRREINDLNDEFLPYGRPIRYRLPVRPPPVFHFAKGDRVKYAAWFLEKMGLGDPGIRSLNITRGMLDTRWHARGVVGRAVTLPDGRQLVIVRWDDRFATRPMRVLSEILIPADRVEPA